jgi:hypothetical protein
VTSAPWRSIAPNKNSSAQNDARVTHPRYGLWCGQRYRLSLSADPGGIGAPDDDVARFGDAETHAESGGDRRERLLEVDLDRSRRRFRGAAILDRRRRNAAAAVAAPADYATVGA